MKDFKQKSIDAIINTLPDDTLISGSESIKFSQTNEIGGHIKKCCIVIKWDEIIEHPCKGCPGYEYACSNPTEVGEKGDEE